MSGFLENVVKGTIQPRSDTGRRVHRKVCKPKTKKVYAPCVNGTHWRCFSLNCTCECHSTEKSPSHT